jgi:thiol-disulfide isomerase/thioredoxin
MIPILALIPSLHPGGELPRVVVFVNHDCPIARRYSPELKRWEKEYSGEVSFKMMYCDTGIGRAALTKHHQEFGLRMEFGTDPKRTISKGYGVVAVPTVIVFSRTNRLIYMGRIDDSYGEDFKWRTPNRRDARDAIEAALSGVAPKVSRTRVIGCAL